MRASHRTQGATLIVSLLFIMVLLAVIMAVTANVTLSSRRSSADQQALTSARYAAESGLARVQARLKVMTELLSDSGLPADTYNSQVQSWLLSMCNGGTMPVNPGQGNPPNRVCDIPGKGLRNATPANNARVKLFVDAVGSAAFHARGLPANTDADRSQFWSDLFSGTGGKQYASSGATSFLVNYGLEVTHLERAGENTFRLYIDVPSLVSEGTSSGVTQRLRASSVASKYYLLISRNSFASYALFTDHFYRNQTDEANNSRIWFNNRILLSGPVHTNQNFAFDGQPWFFGPVTSAGCPAGGIGMVDGKPACTAPSNPGGVFDSTNQEFRNPGENNTATVADTTPNFVGGVKWNSPYIPLPQNSSEQYAEALASGLALNGQVEQLQLYRDQINGQERQRITYTQNGTTVQLSYGEDRKVYLWNPNTNQWEVAAKDASGNIVSRDVNNNPIPVGQQMLFNGVIAANGGINDLNGGPDLNNPSIASFAGITVAATNDVRITSPLKYTVPPCSGSNAPNLAAPCDNLQAKNILGVYASNGDVALISPQSGEPTRLGTNPEMHAILMASQGSVRVQGYNQGTPEGYVNLVGGIIEKYYGAFGTFSGNTVTSGYGRNFVFDLRTFDGYVPPSFPAERWTIGLRSKDEGDDVELNPSTLRGILLKTDAVSTGK